MSKNVKRTASRGHAKRSAYESYVRATRANASLHDSPEL